MTRQTFLWYPDADEDFSCKPLVEVTKFGDGYESRAAKGINSQPVSWNLSFTRSETEANLILAFIKARGGYDSFYWEDPFHVISVFVCREWKVKKMKGNVLQISVMFDQVFEA